MPAAKLLRIKVQRLAAGRALVREIYLGMPANGKVLRLARPGDELKEGLLARLLRKEDAEIYVVLREGVTEDPDTCDLFESAPENPIAASVAAEAPPEAESAIGPAHEDAQAEFTGVASAEESPADATNLARDEQETEALTRVAAGDDAASSVKIDGGADAAETDTNVLGGAAEAAEPGLSFGADPAAAESSTLVGGAPEEEKTTALKGLGKLFKESAQKVRAAAGEEDPQSRFAGDAAEEQRSQKFAVSADGESLLLVGRPDDAGEDSFFSMAGDSHEGADSREHASARPEDEATAPAPRQTGEAISSPGLARSFAPPFEEEITSFSSELEEVAERLVAAARHEPSETLRSQAETIREILEQVRESAAEGDGSAARLLTEALRDTATAIRATAEAEGSTAIRGLAEELSEAVKKIDQRPADFEVAKVIRADSEPASAVSAFSAQQDGILSDAAAMLTVLKASEELKLAVKALREGAEEPEVLRQRIAELKNIISEVSVSGKADAGLQARFGVEQELASMEKAIFEGRESEALAELYQRADEARRSAELAAKMAEEDGEEDPHAQAAVQSTELPAVVSRLAATLAVALGYTDLQYLYEVSLGAILYFTLKDGGNVREEQLPKLTRLLIRATAPEKDFVSADGAEVVSFLAAYLHDPSCDRMAKDLSKRTLTHTFASLQKDAEGPDDWTRARWSQFASICPTIEVQSLCAKASAWAVRDAKSFVS